jgi:maltooligosyltrehalose trehalohydrolase
MDPSSRQAYERCKLDRSERETHTHAVALHRDLIALRRTDPVFAAQRPGSVDGAVLSDAAFVLRYFDREGEHGDRLLLVNLGREVCYTPTPEPLLAPPVERRWKVIWASEDVAYGGTGAPDPCAEDHWRMPAYAALVFAAERDHDV